MGKKINNLIKDFLNHFDHHPRQGRIAFFFAGICSLIFVLGYGNNAEKLVLIISAFK